MNEKNEEWVELPCGTGSIRVSARLTDTRIVLEGPRFVRARQGPAWDAASWEAGETPIRGYFNLRARVYGNLMEAPWVLDVTGGRLRASGLSLVPGLIAAINLETPESWPVCSAAVQKRLETERASRIAARRAEVERRRDLQHQQEIQKRRLDAQNALLEAALQPMDPATIQMLGSSAEGRLCQAALAYAAVFNG